METCFKIPRAVEETTCYRRPIVFEHSICRLICLNWSQTLLGGSNCYTNWSYNMLQHCNRSIAHPLSWRSSTVPSLPSKYHWPNLDICPKASSRSGLLEGTGKKYGSCRSCLRVSQQESHVCSVSITGYHGASQNLKWSLLQLGLVLWRLLHL